MALLALALLVLSVVQITRTYSVFNHTWDEPSHLAAGMQLLDTGEYSYELQHPPLARLATALGPWLSGIHAHGDPNKWNEGGRLLYDAGDYQRTLGLARSGILPFFVLLVVVAWFWARSLGGVPAALLATLFITTQPVLLAHAGFATTDMPMAALSMAALFAFVRWLDQPTAWRSILLGVATGLAFMAKFSAIPFLAVGFLIVILYRWAVESRSWNPLQLTRVSNLGYMLISAVFLFLSAWAVYGFSWAEYSSDSFTISLPAVIPSTLGGIKAVAYHNSIGHWSYLLGERGQHGWWYFFPVAVIVKATIPLLILSALGFVLALRRGRADKDWKSAAPGLIVLAIMAFSTTTHINIGARHVLLVFPLLALQAGLGVLWLLRQKVHPWSGHMFVTLLIIWQGSIVLSAFPDYLSWFNALAGQRPERILINSDLDWGQDLDRLARKTQEAGIDHLAIAYNGYARLDRHGLPPNTRLEPGRPVTGWVAISLLTREVANGYGWLKQLRAITRVGTSIDLYYVKPSDLPLSERAEAIKREALIRESGLRDTERARAIMREALVLRYELGDTQGAEALFAEILAINPKHYGAHWQRASALQDLGRLDEAVLEWEVVIKMARDNHDAAGEMDAQTRLGRLRRSISQGGQANEE